MRSWIRFTLLAAVVLGMPWRASAQAAPASPPPPLRVFLDCYECDTEYLRQNVTFVDYVRDRAVADIHVLVTTQSTGAGGTSWTVRFIGLGRFESVDRVHTFSTRPASTSDDRRRGFARVFRLGLTGYAADTAVSRDLEVTWSPPAAAPGAAPVKDKWRLWVFRVSGNGNVSGERATKSYRYGMSLSANRVTPDWKINISTNRNENESRFTLSDGRTVKSGSDSWNASTTVVKSLGPKLSAGARIGASHSSFSNVDRSVHLYPGIEYDFFPYADFQRRSLTVWYEFGAVASRYRDLTLFDKLRETVPKHQVEISLALRQPWGSLRTTTTFMQNLRYRDRYNASVWGSTDVRLFKGFSFNVYGSYGKIKDQSSLRKAEASTEEVLLRIRQLSTNYRYSYSFGLSYNFGSVYTSIVNPRFSGPTFFFF